MSDDVGCAADLVQEGVSGYIFPTGDIGALTDALCRVLVSPAVAQQMGANAFVRIQQWGFEQDIQGIRQAVQHLSPGFTA